MRHRDIFIRFVPKEQLRYESQGDYFDTPQGLTIQISDEVPEDEQFLVALHELVEWKLCSRRGITNNAIDAFDFSFHGEGEPGDSEHSPYRREHRFAMLIEHLMAHEMGVIGYGKVE